VAVGLRGVIRKGLIGRRRRRIPLNQPEREMIVRTRKDQRGIEEEESTIIASGAYWRCSPLPHRRHGGG
jgi:hypothetical protein